MSENPIGVPWDQPGADPIGDIRRYVEEVRNQPFLVKIKVIQALYDRIRAWATNDSHPAGFPSQNLLNALLGYPSVPIEIDDTLPADPGWEAVWST